MSLAGRFRRRRCAIEVSFSAGWGDRRQCLNDKTFRAAAGNGMNKNILKGCQSKQRICNAAVAHVNPRRLDQTFSDICMPRLEPSHQQQID